MIHPCLFTYSTNYVHSKIIIPELKRALNKLVLSNWVKGLPQIIPVYNTSTPKTAKEAGILAQDVEWDLEKPCKLDSNQVNLEFRMTRRSIYVNMYIIIN